MQGHHVPPPTILTTAAWCCIEPNIVITLYLILYFDVILDVGAGGDGGHVASGELLQLLGLKGVGARLSPDSFCLFCPHSPHWYLPRYGGGNATHIQ